METGGEGGGEQRGEGVECRRGEERSQARLPFFRFTGRKRSMLLLLFDFDCLFYFPLSASILPSLSSSLSLCLHRGSGELQGVRGLCLSVTWRTASPGR